MKPATHKILMASGMLSSVLYFAMNIFVPMLDPTYDVLSQTISELSAIDAPTRKIWVWLAAFYTLFVGLFGYGILKSSSQNRPLRIVGILMLIHAGTDVLWPFARMHLRPVLAAGGGSLKDTLHIALSFATVILMSLMIGFGAAAFDKGFRNYSIITLLILILFGILTSMEAPGISKNLPTPYIGLWERINVGVFMIWMIELALKLLQIRMYSPRSVLLRAEFRKI